jgi:hypothetical protein
MQVAANRVAAPDQDELCLGKKLHLHAHLAAQRLHQGFGTGRRADGAVQLRGAQAVEKAPVHALALHHAHGAGVAVGQDGLRVARGDGARRCGDVGQGFVPADGCELAAALGARALEGREDALGVVAALGVAGDLGAQHAIGVRVVGVALHAGGHAVFHRGEQGAGVGAVVRAGAAHLAQGSAGGSISWRHGVMANQARGYALPAPAWGAR